MGRGGGWGEVPVANWMRASFKGCFRRLAIVVKRLKGVWV